MNPNPEFHFPYIALPSSSSSSPALLSSDSIPSPVSVPEVRISRYAVPDFDQLVGDSSSPFNGSPFIYSFASPIEPKLRSPEPEAPRIPRPPNAFMLFRSNMLRTKAIPQTAEKRQQQLSKVAGECWNLLSPREKQVWHDEAARQLREHQLKYPNYKFTPAARGSSRKMKKSAEQSATADRDRVRELREKWTQIYGPAAVPSRRRKPKQKVHNLPRSDPDPNTDSLCNDPALAFLSSPTSSLPSSPSNSIGDGNLPPVFPNPSYPHYSETQPYNFSGFFMNNYPFPRPPSTSSNSSCDGSVYSSASSFDTPSYYVSASPRSGNELCAGFSNIDLTPTATSFRDSNSQPQPPNPLRQPPSFLSLNNQRASSEPPFLSPLVPSPTSEPSMNILRHSPAESTSTSPGLATSLSYDSLKLDELDFSSIGPISSMNGDHMAFGCWNYMEDGRFLS